VTLPTVQPVATAPIATQLGQLYARIEAVEKRIADRDGR
jgi:hypothetical protein